MKILKNKKTDFTVTLELEADYTDIEKATEPAYQELVKDAKVPGFRPGKVPRPVFEKHYGREMLVQRASTIVMNDCYKQAVAAEKLEPVDYPKNVEIKTLEKDKPFVFTLAVDVKPEIKLGRYKGLKIKRDAAEVKSEEIDRELNQVREYHAEYKNVERPAQNDDLVGYALKAFALDGRPLAELAKERTGTRLGTNFMSPDFDREIAGMKINETKKFRCRVNADYFVKSVAGQEIDCEVLLLEIKERVLPELNDEFIKKISAKQTVAEMREEIKTNLTAQKKTAADNQAREKFIEELLKENDFTAPQALIEDKLNVILRNLEIDLRNKGLEFSRYLQALNKDAAALRADYRPVAEKRAKLDLILEKVAEKENVRPTDAEIEAELDKIMNSGRQEPLKPAELAKFKKSLPESARKQIISYLTEDKCLEFLLNNAKITE
ncbi:MAG: trigger factor [Candidatus Margulisbacteria bacterium]|jgi:trigger factor|nr:trigger factor [Candidatus Margulisiibacteriota bacterium]